MLIFVFAARINSACIADRLKSDSVFSEVNRFETLERRHDISRVRRTLPIAICLILSRFVQCDTRTISAILRSPVRDVSRSVG